MKKLVVLVTALILTLTVNPLFSLAEGKPNLSPKCIEEMKNRDEQRNKLIMRDIISSFNLDIDESSYNELTFQDLDAAYLVYGGRVDDTYYNSLRKVFETTSNTQGQPRLYVKPLTAYFLYKEGDYTNVMILLKLKDKKWEVVERKKKDGKEIQYNKVKCEKDYLEKKYESYNKR
jgi:hypothetical protein